MMKIKHFAALTILAALMPLAVKANTVTLYQGDYSYSVGGEFTAVTSPSFTGNGYAASTLINGGFQTFCIETGVNFSPGHQYYYTVGTISQPLSGGGAGSGLALSAGAAYLYYEFATGNLTGYNYANSTSGARQANAGSLQAAIWYLQGNQIEGGYPSWNNSFYNDALANANSTYLSAVNVLQLWSNPDNTDPAQNQLVLTGRGPTPNPNVPDGGMTAILLGGALVGLQFLRRQLAS